MYSVKQYSNSLIATFESNYSEVVIDLAIAIHNLNWILG